MATVRVTRKRAEQAARTIDGRKLDALTDAGREAAALADPDNPPLSGNDLKRLAAAAMIRRIRKRSGLSQIGFARRYRFPIGTLRDWEQGRRAPEAAVFAYLTVIDRMPDEVQAALAPAKPRRCQRVSA